MKVATIGYLLDEENVLLVYKKRGFGQGLYNGFGGKVERGETFEQALVREAQEEIGVTPVTYHHMASIMFYDANIPAFSTKVFLIDEWVGHISESEEVKPEWFRINDLPLDKMWEDDKYWLHRVIGREKLDAHFYFEELFGQAPKLIKYDIKNL